MLKFGIHILIWHCIGDAISTSKIKIELNVVTTLTSNTNKKERKVRIFFKKRIVKLTASREMSSFQSPQEFDQ